MEEVLSGLFSPGHCAKSHPSRTPRSDFDRFMLPYCPNTCFSVCDMNSTQHCGNVRPFKRIRSGLLGVSCMPLVSLESVVLACSGYSGRKSAFIPLVLAKTIPTSYALLARDQRGRGSRWKPAETPDMVDGLGLPLKTITMVFRTKMVQRCFQTASSSKGQSITRTLPNLPPYPHCRPFHRS